MTMLTWLADELRGAGLKVVEEPGWKTRGRGEMGTVKGVICHHTGAGSSEGLRHLVLQGRSDLPGPLSHLFLDDDGTFYVIAAGRCNHAGAGKWQGVTSGNSSFVGIEAKNAGDGKDLWEAVQMDAYTRGVAAILGHIHADSVMAAGHKEYALPKGRKTDPTFDMFTFREAVQSTMAGYKYHGVPATVDPVRSMLQKGSQGPDVKKLQQFLKDLHFYTDTVDGGFGPKTEYAVKAFQKSKGLLDDGKVGPKTWVALGVK